MTGYLYVSASSLARDPATEGRLPDDGLVEDDHGGAAGILASERKYLPAPVWLASDGEEEIERGRFLYHYDEAAFV